MSVKESHGVRYVGSKRSILKHIGELIRRRKIPVGMALDAFAGSACVSRSLRRRGFVVHACDSLRSSYLLQRIDLEHAAYPEFGSLPFDDLGIMIQSQHEEDSLRLTSVLGILNKLPGLSGFAATSYSSEIDCIPEHRMYFTRENGERLDAIRDQVDRWNKKGFLTAAEYDFLIGLLVIAAHRYANTTGHFDAPLRANWYSGARKSLQLRSPSLLPSDRPLGKAHHEDISRMLDCKEAFELAYLDPPYNNRRYDRLYHVPEQLATPEWVPQRVGGRTAKPVALGLPSRWCSVREAPGELESCLGRLQANHVIMSYSSDGILTKDQIRSALKQYGRAGTYNCRKIPHRRYVTGNGQGGAKGGGTVTEYLFYVSRV